MHTGVFLSVCRVLTSGQIAAPVGRHDDASAPKAVKGKLKGEVVREVDVDAPDDRSNSANNIGKSFHTILCRLHGLTVFQSRVGEMAARPRKARVR